MLPAADGLTERLVCAGKNGASAAGSWLLRFLCSKNAARTARSSVTSTPTAIPAIAPPARWLEFEVTSVLGTVVAEPPAEEDCPAITSGAAEAEELEELCEESAVCV